MFARMVQRHPVLERLSRGQLVAIDGDMSEDLTSRGYHDTGPVGDATAPREVPDMLEAVHRAYADAGADVLTAHTAGTTVRALARGGIGMRAAALTGRAVDLALESVQHVQRPVAVAGALASLTDPSSANREVSLPALAEEHNEQATRLQAAGCHLALIRAMPTLRETLAATAAARRAIDVVWVTLALKGRNHLTDDSTLEAAASYLVAVGAQALLVQGTAQDLSPAIEFLSSLSLGVTLGARLVCQAGESTLDPNGFVTELAQAIQHGARILGGTRGYTPEHVRTLATKVHAHTRALF